MEIQRKCQWCGKPFIAHTMVTRYCSKSCNEKAYKEKKRKQRLQEYEERQNEQPMQEVGIVGSKLYLSPAETATLLGISRATIYRHMATGIIGHCNFAGVPLSASRTLKKCLMMHPVIRNGVMEENRPFFITLPMRFWRSSKFRRKHCIVDASYTTSLRLKKAIVCSTTAPL